MGRHRIKLRYRVADALRPGVLLGIVLIVIGVAACADRVVRRTSGKHPYDRSFDRQTAVVTHVADGDTIDVDFDDPEPPVRVRLLGVDSPELDSPFGRTAASYTAARSKGARVTIRLDDLQSTRDKYGRLLAYVYLPNHELLNNSLVRDGHAFVYRPKRCDFSSMFESSENQARTGKRGMWKTMTIAEMPEWRQRWMKERGLK